RGLRARGGLRAGGAARRPGLLLRRRTRGERGRQRVREAREPLGSSAAGRERRVLPGEGARDLGALPRLRRARRPAAARGRDGARRPAGPLLRRPPRRRSSVVTIPHPPLPREGRLICGPRPPRPFRDGVAALMDLGVSTVACLLADHEMPAELVAAY